MVNKSPDVYPGMDTISRQGVLVLVAGPSGAGKDSILNGAQTLLRSDDRFQFARRIITRPKDLTEDHAECSEDDFHDLKDNGALLFHWNAHGLWYGVPASVSDELAGGKVVCVNVSRSIIDSARERFGNVVTVLVDAPPDVLSERLSGRGRESQTQARERLDRRIQEFSLRSGDVRIVNDGSLGSAIAQFVEILKSSARD